MSRKETKLAAVSPERKRIGALLAFFLGLFSLVALLDYSPFSIHESPSDQSSPVLGKVGVITARTLLGWFGFRLGCCHCSPEFKRMLLQKILGKTIFSQYQCSVGHFFNLHLIKSYDFTTFSSGDGPMFDSNTYEHGAGGSIGAYFYSGLPFFDPHLMEC